MKTLFLQSCIRAYIDGEHYNESLLTRKQQTLLHQIGIHITAQLLLAVTYLYARRNVFMRYCELYVRYMSFRASTSMDMFSQSPIREPGCSEGDLYALVFDYMHSVF